MKKYIQKSNTDISHIEDEWMVLNTEQFTVTKLNEVGGYCYSLLKEAQTVEALMEAINRQFDTKETLNEQDIEQFVDQLMECGLVDYAL